MKTIGIFILTILLTGCSSFDYPFPQNLSKSVVSDDNSLVLLSTWAHEKSISSGTGLKIVDLKTNEVMAGAAIDAYHFKPHFKKGWGFYTVLQLPPGTYYYELTAINPYMSYEDQQKVTGFTIEPSTINYLGEIYFYRSESHGNIELRNKSDRDIDYFIERNSEFQKEDFNKLIIENLNKS